MTGPLKDNLFVLTALQGGLRGLRQTPRNGIITSPYPEVTLDTFGFLVGAHSAVWPQLPKITTFGPKMHIIALYRMASYDTAWN